MLYSQDGFGLAACYCIRAAACTERRSMGDFLGEWSSRQNPQRQNDHLRKALQSYNRKKGLREFAVWIAFCIASVVPFWALDSRTEYLVWYLAIATVMLLEQQRKHIRAMQVRLAMMSDQLAHLIGEDEYDVLPDNVIAELSEA